MTAIASLLPLPELTLDIASGLTPALFMYQINDLRSLSAPLPIMYDLPSEDPEEPGLPDEFYELLPTSTAPGIVVEV